MVTDWMRFFRKTLSSRSQHGLLALGGLVLAGAGLLAAGLYLFVLSDESSGLNDNAEVVDLSEGPVDLDIRPPTPIELTPTPAPAAPLGDAGYQLVIDKLGVNAPVSTFGVDEKLVPEVPYTATDVAWYDFSARPGTGGNAVFAGHVTWNGPAVFYDLNKLEKGDEVRLQGYDGTKVVYRVSSVFQVDPDDPESLKVMWDATDDVITIITCSGKFFETGDPILRGDYTHRLIVRGDLISVDPPAPTGG
jgi:LPXTG-site transpeptidase (sortase) family protein